MSNAFNELIIKVYAIDVRRGVEGTKNGQIRILNPAPVMGPIMATSMMGAVFFTWPRNVEIDFAGYRVSSWMSDEAGNNGATTIVDVTSNHFQKGYSEADKNLNYTIANISVTAFDTFEQESYPQTASGTIEGLNIKPTDINGFALKASQMFTSAIALEGEQFFSNTPSGGSVSWNAHKVFVRGVEFQILAGSTDKKYIYFKTDLTVWPTIEEFETKDYVHPVKTAQNYSSSDSHPADSDLQTSAQIDMNFSSCKYGQIIAVNWDGTYDMAWNAIANQIIGSAYIMNGAINDAHISNLTAGKITAGSAFIGGVSIGGMTTLDISMGEFGKLPIVPPTLPGGLYITRDFIGYYHGPVTSLNKVVTNGVGIIEVKKGSNMVTGDKTVFKSYVDSMDFTRSGSFNLSIPVVSANGSSTKEFPFTWSGVLDDVRITLSGNADTDYSGRFCVIDRNAGVHASNLWAYVFKADGTIAVQEGGRIVVGNNNIIMDSLNKADGTSGHIIVAPDGGAEGNNCLLLNDGKVTEYFWDENLAPPAHVKMKSLKNIVVGDCISGVSQTIDGHFKTPPIVMIMAPASMVSDPNQIHVPFKIVSYPGNVISAGSTTWSFNPKIGIEYSGGVWAHKGPTGCAYTIGILATETTLQNLTGSIVCPKNTTQVRLEFSAQTNMNTDLMGIHSGRFSLKYQKTDDTWVNDGAYIDVNMSNLAINDYGINISDVAGIKNVVLSFTPVSNAVNTQLRGDVSTLSTYIDTPYFYENGAQAKYIAFASNE